MALRSKLLGTWLIWAALSLPASTSAFAQADACAWPRAVIAGETALRDALSRNDGNVAPLLGALSRLADQAAPGPEIAVYLASRRELAAALGAGDGLKARRLMRRQPHRLAGQNVLVALRADDECMANLSPADTDATITSNEGGQITSGHGDVATKNATSATGGGQASRPGGPGIKTSPLSFLKGFDVTLHVLPAIGATLAFGALVFGLTRDRRKYRRYLCHMPVEIVGPKGPVASTLLDVSRGGAKLARTEKWLDGDHVKIRFERDAPPRAARVMWVNDGFVGILFRKPLSPPTFQNLLARANAGAGAAEREAP